MVIFANIMNLNLKKKDSMIWRGVYRNRKKAEICMLHIKFEAAFIRKKKTKYKNKNKSVDNGSNVPILLRCNHSIASWYFTDTRDTVSLDRALTLWNQNKWCESFQQIKMNTLITIANAIRYISLAISVHGYVRLLTHHHHHHYLRILLLLLLRLLLVRFVIHRFFFFCFILLISIGLIRQAMNLNGWRLDNVSAVQT